jgi:hypothetical protein
MINDLFTDNSFGARILQALIIGLAAFLTLFLLDRIVERVSPKVTKKVEGMTTGDNVLRIRRAETFTGLAITVVRILVVVVA